MCVMQMGGKYLMKKKLWRTPRWARWARCERVENPLNDEFHCLLSFSSFPSTTTTLDDNSAAQHSTTVTDWAVIRRYEMALFPYCQPSSRSWIVCAMKWRIFCVISTSAAAAVSLEASHCWWLKLSEFLDTQTRFEVRSSSTFLMGQQPELVKLKRRGSFSLYRSSYSHDMSTGFPCVCERWMMSESLTTTSPACTREWWICQEVWVSGKKSFIVCQQLLTGEM